MDADFLHERKTFSGAFEESLDAHREHFLVNCRGQHVPDGRKVRLLLLLLADGALKCAASL